MNQAAVLGRLRRVRWGVRATLAFGVIASISANILHAQPNIISQVISAWPPLALLLTVELTSRIPMHRPLLATIRVLATAVIAGIAAWVSYWHMQDVAVRFGETEISAYLLPISVDGLIVVASVSLVELAGRIRTLETTSTNPQPTPPAPATPAPVTSAAAIPAAATPAAAIPAAGAVAAVDERGRVDEDQGVDDVLDEALIARAHQVAAEHYRRTGGDITRDQLRAALRVSNRTASRLLHLVRATARGGEDAGAGNGVSGPDRVRVPAVVVGNGPVVR